MKRIGYLYYKIYDMDNLRLADKKARRGKSNRKEIIKFDLNKEENLIEIHNSLKDKTFTTSPYSIFKINEGKERIVYKLPYKDRIVHHAIMNILEPIFTSLFISDTYSCIKGRGIHSASYKLRKALKETNETKYCLKIDIKKFYPSVDNKILKSLLMTKFKDHELLWLLDNIIDSEKGLPIGNLTSQTLANFYLTGFDKYLKQELKIKNLWRYCDDIVILHSDKEYLKSVLIKIESYLYSELNLQLKSNYQIFPVSARGIDFVGYKHFHTHVLLRKSIKKRFIKMLFKNRNHQSVASYNGWLKHCDSINLKHKLIPNG